MSGYAADPAANGSRKQHGRQAPLGVCERHLVGAGEDGHVGLRKWAALELVHRCDRFRRKSGRDGAGDVLLVAGTAAVQRRQSEPRQLPVTLIDIPAGEDSRVDMRKASGNRGLSLSRSACARVPTDLRPRRRFTGYDLLMTLIAPEQARACIARWTALARREAAALTHGDLSRGCRDIGMECGDGF